MDRFFIVIAALVMALAPPARADDASRLAVAREVVALAGTSDQFNHMIGVMEPIFVATIRSSYPPDQAVRLGQLFTEESRAEIPALLEQTATAYAAALSEEDLVDLRDFYRSHAGQAYVHALPAMSAAMEQYGAAAGRACAARALQRLRDEQSRTHGGT